MRIPVSRWRVGAVFLLVASIPASSVAQSLTHGALRGVILYADNGGPIAGVQVTLESSDGTPLLYLETDGAGRFQVPLLSPGVYRLLAEQVGLQPVRVVGLSVSGGQTAAVTIRLERRPPPIERVIEVQHTGVVAGTGLGRTLDRGWLSHGIRRLGIAGVGRGLSEFESPRDAREGMAVTGGGLSASTARLVVDGVPEPLARHLGLPGEPAAAPLFAQGAFDQVQILTLGLDSEWRGYQGATVAANTARGGNAVRFKPYAFASSATVGADAKDNPADSSATSLLAGAELSGPIVRDTAFFVLRFDYRRERTPSAHPWENDQSLFGGQAVSLRTRLPEIARDSFGTTLSRWVSPAVRSWTGFSGLGRLDWRLGNNMLFARVGIARWAEEAPLLLDERSNLAGSELEASDLSLAAGVTSDFGTAANEIRAGFSTARREWRAPPLAATRVVAEGIAFGGSPALPARFDLRTFDLSNAFQVVFRQHRFKVGASLTVLDYQQDYRYGRDGVFSFGSLDAFGRGEGSYFQTVGPQRIADPRFIELGLFAQDTWTLSPEFTILAGIRWSRQQLPANRIALNQQWLELTGRRNDFLPSRGELSPRGGFVWDVQSRGEWIIRGGGGLYAGSIEPPILSEVMLHDGSVTVRRGHGAFSTWPTRPELQQAPDQGRRLTLLSDTYRAPRTAKGGLSVSRAFQGGVAFHLTGIYQHTDFLPRRVNLNRVPVTVARTEEGRPLYGVLVQQGGLIEAAPGSNSRFRGFELVSGLAPTGFADYYEVTALLERRVAAGLSVAASYTLSSARDNVLGSLAMDPADQLDPFPESLDGQDWSEGTSDYDIPHRVAIMAEYRTAGRTPIGLGIRWRYRSGLPFTPGFRPGVDVNGDGSGGNDPAYLTAEAQTLLAAGRCTAALNSFAPRNSCREDAAYGLDLTVSVGLSVGGGQRLALVLDAFNVVSSAVGLVDRALWLVDRNGTLTTDSQGRVALPLVPNPDFGNLLSRRNDPRLVRVGLRLEY
jgi:hypothetical protein